MFLNAHDKRMWGQRKLNVRISNKLNKICNWKQKGKSSVMIQLRKSLSVENFFMKPEKRNECEGVLRKTLRKLSTSLFVKNRLFSTFPSPRFSRHVPHHKWSYHKQYTTSPSCTAVSYHCDLFRCTITMFETSNSSTEIWVACSMTFLKLEKNVHHCPENSFFTLKYLSRTSIKFEGVLTIKHLLNIYSSQIDILFSLAHLFILDILV